MAARQMALMAYWYSDIWNNDSVIGSDQWWRNDDVRINRSWEYCQLMAHIDGREADMKRNVMANGA